MKRSQPEKEKRGRDTYIERGDRQSMYFIFQKCVYGFMYSFTFCSVSMALSSFVDKDDSAAAISAAGSVAVAWGESVCEERETGKRKIRKYSANETNLYGLSGNL